MDYPGRSPEAGHPTSRFVLGTEQAQSLRACSFGLSHKPGHPTSRFEMGTELVHLRWLWSVPQQIRRLEAPAVHQLHVGLAVRDLRAGAAVDGDLRCQRQRDVEVIHVRQLVAQTQGGVIAHGGREQWVDGGVGDRVVQ